MRERPPRGAYLLEQQAAFYAGNGDARWPAWRAARAERDRTYMAEARRRGRPTTRSDDGGGYEGEAMAVVEAIATNTRARADRQHRQPLRAAVPGRARGRRGAVRRRPRRARGRSPSGDVPDHARALIETIKAVERATIEAALTGSSELAVKALALHPLVPVGHRRARDLRRLPRAAARAAGALRDERRPRRRRRRRSSTSRSSGSSRCPGPARSASPATCCARPAAARSPRSAPRGSGCGAALAAPLGEDLAGDFVREALEREGIAASLARRGARTPTTVVMPVGGERAMVTYDPGVRTSAAEVAALEPRAVGGQPRPARRRARTARAAT